MWKKDILLVRQPSSFPARAMKKSMHEKQAIEAR
jgi:hypothetical protein